jgi:hypothetical protein
MVSQVEFKRFWRVDRDLLAFLRDAGGRWPG